MNAPAAKTSKSRQELAAAYEAVSPAEQSAIELLSVIYEKVPRNTLLACLHEISLQGGNQRLFAPQTLAPLIHKLARLGLVDKLDGNVCCPRLFVEEATRRAVEDGHFENMAETVQKVFEGEPLQRYEQCLREIRIGLYRQDAKYVYQQFEYCAKHFPEEFSRRHPYQIICNDPFDADWTHTLSTELVVDILLVILDYSERRLEPAEEAFDLLDEYFDLAEGEDLYLVRQTLAEQLILRGRTEEAKKLVENEEGPEMAAIQGWLDFLADRNDDAIGRFETALESLKKKRGEEKVFFNVSAGIFFTLALIKTNAPVRLEQAREYAAMAIDLNYQRFLPVYELLLTVIDAQKGDNEAVDKIRNMPISIEPTALVNSLATYLQALALFAIDSTKAKKTILFLEEAYGRSEDCGYHWFTGELAELLSRLLDGDALYASRADEQRAKSGAHSLIGLFKAKEPWERRLTALIELSGPAGGAETASSQSRLAWFLTLDSKNNTCKFQPREQKRSPAGKWSKGRTMPLKRLRETTAELDFLTPQDIKVCSCIQEEYEHGYAYYGKTYYAFNANALPALAGHPLLFWADSPATRVELVKGEPELLISKKPNKQLFIQIMPSAPSGRGSIAVKESQTRLKLVEIREEHHQIMDILGEGLQVPAAARERVLEAINAVSTLITIHSDIGGGIRDAEEMPADPRPHMHLFPLGEGLKLEVLSRPFAKSGPYYRPGSGGETVIAEVDGKRLQTKRDLQQEKKQAEEAVTACNSLAHLEEVDGEWPLEDPDNCLELLLELQELGNKAVVEWPEGEKFKIKQQASLKGFNMNIRWENNWFNATGELQLDDGLVLSMQNLLGLIEQGSGRFVPLEDGEFLALTQEFRKRLDELQTFSELHGKGVRFHPLAALALEDLTNEVGTLKTDKRWKTHMKRLHDVQALRPELPSTLRAELRDYQLEGFQWLARLAYWRVGACLADDMGLGKTIQALALILTRAPEGPSLIVAPTSVCMNWHDEVIRFAPTLNTISFSGGNRRKILEDLKPFDMLVCSYGLLQQEEEMLAEIQWQTIVLDEAQAIKNIATKRSQAAMTLQGEFKLITTGTPIENHLGEVWNLFRFINPGLLSSLEKFNQQFAIPIEKNGDKNVRNKLKKLIQPFILRRTKSQVLQELPPRTEILLHVELSEEERAFYEALRRQAVSRLSEIDSPAGQKHMQILAEIMRLRRACCNARLVVPDSPLSSSKLAVFGEVVEELLENRHKALVFSQFVGHLAFLREYLDERNISYQYLDGSTPAKARKTRVDAFQAGEGDVFLISLKAGGLGLNLTAADYVIHMDPWWNPAVEDQASDRAHRIGQLRPVTIYRLVARDTIEEKIVALHHRKRDLADSLLEGSDMSGKVSAAELLQLISEQ
ncbi:MAG: DEAD/DEAH box helicase [Gammaproteobacteria bacterium]|nr:DEAD/DEAH box helicase [Gammaproteobacteria bacterium]